MSVTAICLQCGAEYHPYPVHYRTGRTRFCSRVCADAGRLGTPEERFWRNVQKTSHCWIYDSFGSRRGGYGRLLVNGKAVPAHRFSWELHFGPIPDGLLVCHRCDNRPCIRPDHLFLGTHADNATDKVNKGRETHVGPTNPSRGESRYNARLTSQDVVRIRMQYTRGGATQRSLARQFGVGTSTIHKIVHGKKWRHVPTP